MVPRMLDVIVVGAGPAGLYAAPLLAGEGFDVTVVEEHAAPGLPTHCTGVVSDEISEPCLRLRRKSRARR